MAKSDYSAIGMQALVPGIEKGHAWLGHICELEAGSAAEPGLKYLLARAEEEMRNFSLVLGSANGSDRRGQRAGFGAEATRRTWWDKLPPEEQARINAQRQAAREATMIKRYGKNWSKKINLGRKKATGYTKSKAGQAIKSYWDKMTAEERRAEMKKRFAKRKVVA